MIPKDVIGRIAFFGYCSVPAGEYSDERVAAMGMLIDRTRGRYDILYPDTKDNRLAKLKTQAENEDSGT